MSFRLSSCLILLVLSLTLAACASGSQSEQPSECTTADAKGVACQFLQAMFVADEQTMQNLISPELESVMGQVSITFGPDEKALVAGCNGAEARYFETPSKLVEGGREVLIVFKKACLKPAGIAENTPFQRDRLRFFMKQTSGNWFFLTWQLVPIASPDESQ
jgi:hypothetical protein